MADKAQLLFTKTHEWLEVLDDNACRVGITDYAQDMLGDIVYVRLPDTGEKTEAGQPFMDLESVKAVSDVYSPVTGEVLETNDALDSAPELLNTETYGAWIAKISFKSLDRAAFMSADEYDEYVKGL